MHHSSSLLLHYAVVAHPSQKKLKGNNLKMNFSYFTIWLGCVLNTLTGLHGAEESSFSGLTFKLYDNAGLANTPVLQGLSTSAQLSLEEQDPEGDEAPCYLSGELLGSVSFVKDGVYELDCQFVDTSTGWVWLDGHLMCGDNNTFRPESLDNPLPVGRTLPFRAHITSNDTSCKKLANVRVSWREIIEDEETSFRLLTDSQYVSLGSSLPSAEEKRDSLQRNVSIGWGAWLHHSILSLVKLPEGLVVTPKLCHLDTCLEFATPESKGIRVGLHAFDRSYVTYSMTYNDANVTVEYSVQDDQVYFLITPIALPQNSSDYEIQIDGRYAWYRPGEVSTTTNEAGTDQLIFSTPGLGAVNVTLAIGANTIFREVTAAAEERWLQQTDDNACLRLQLTKPGQPVGFAANVPFPSLEDITAKIKESKLAEEARRKKKFGDSKYAVAEAIQSTVMWTLIYNPLENQGLFMPVSRIERWTFPDRSGAATTDWTYIIFDWDNLFASLLAGLDNRDISYSNLFQVIKSKTAAGFVPNLATGGYKSQDRTEPPIGAKATLELFRKYNDTWVVDVVFDDLLDWNDWFLARRILQPAGLVALGTYAETFGQHMQQRPKSRSDSALAYDELQKAKFESGMDNSPMYDDAPFDEESHLMQLYDVGMSSLFVQEAYSLAELADAIGRDTEVGKSLRSRGDSMREKIRSELWNPDQQIFANRFPNGTFSNRISPTSFYPLLIGAATEAQAESMVHSWLLNASRFCISPNGDFDGNDPNGCYYGLPSISADDPAYMAGPNNYWRGLVWGPLAQLVYWGLREAASPSNTEQQTNFDLARQALCQQMETLLMSQWNSHRHICENYHPSLNGSDDCSGTPFYHWGALLGLIGMMEDGLW